MKTHKQFEPMLMLYFHNELSARDAAQFEKHLAECPECSAALQRLNDMQAVLEHTTRAVPAPALIERANARVMSAIRQTKKRKFKWSLTGILDEIQEAFTGFFAHPRYQLIAIGATFVIGVFVGKLWLSSGLRHDPGMLANFVNYQVALTDTEKEQLQKVMANYLIQSGGVEVADLIQSSTDDDGMVEVNLKVDRDIAIKGGLDDPTILNMLQYSAIHDQDPSRRLRAIKLLAKSPQNSRNESTMISVLLNDSDPEVREQAMDALESYDLTPRIMDAFKTIALRDSSFEIRRRAVKELYQSADETTVPILALIATNDPDSTLRKTAQNYLDIILEKSNQQVLQ
ncbi:MAG: HEAT repeat domain-containing protein [Fidelibacterota bacterium]